MTKSIFAITLIIVFFGIAAFVFYRKSNNTNDTAKIGLNPSVSIMPSPAPSLILMPSPTPESNKMIQMENGLKIQDLRVGTGPEAKTGDTISVNYIGSLDNGTVFDASAKHGGPATFQIGVGKLIRGWDIGIPGMKVGGKRKLIVPSSLGYGSQNIGNGAIPSNSTLIFEVELLAVQSPGK